MLRPLLLCIASTLCLFASLAQAKPKRVILSDCFVLQHTSSLWSGRNTDLYERLPDGSERRIASLERAGFAGAAPSLIGVLRRDPPNGPMTQVAVSRDGRSVVYWARATARKGEPRTENGIYRWVCGGRDTLLHRMSEMPEWSASVVGDVMVFVTRDTTRRPAEMALAVFADDGEVPLVLLGASPLHAAAFHGQGAEVDSLLDHGADPAASNLFNMSPLDVALYTGQDEASLRIIRHPRADTALFVRAMRWAIPFGRWKAVAGMLERGVSPNAPYDRTHTPLIGAVENPRQPSFDGRERPDHLDLLHLVPRLRGSLRSRESIAEGVRLLLDHGANPNQVGPGGFTPLHEIATWTRATEAARLLIERGADLGMTARKGNTPLHTLVASRRYYSEDSTRALLELYVAHTKNFECRNAAGFTPVERAIGAHNFMAAHYLVEHGASDTIVFFGHTVREILADELKHGRGKNRFEFELKLQNHYGVPRTESLIPAGTARDE